MKKGTDKSLASEKWNNAHSIPQYRQRFFNSIDWARKYTQDIYLENKYPFQILRSQLSSPPVGEALELAGGRGDFSIALIKSKLASRVHMIDISNEAIKIANEKAKKLGIANFSAEVQDVNKVKISGKFDLITFSQSLHHIEELEFVLSQVKRALKPNGVFYVSDYIGPTRMQWTDLQLQIMNRVLNTIPEELRVQLNLDGTISKTIKKQIKRIPIETFLKVDPSEAVRSGEIIKQIKKAFKRVDFYPLGGAITYEVFRNIAHNFSTEDETIRSLMKTIINLEYYLTKHEILAPNFGIFICKD